MLFPLAQLCAPHNPPVHPRPPFVQLDDAFDGLVYQRDFPTEPASWQQLDLMFDTFKPNFRGRLVPGAPPLQGAGVRQLGLMVSKFSDVGGLTPGFRPGAFKLAVKWMRGIL